MSLLNWYQGNYRIWKKFKTLPAPIRDTGRWPSETYNKYHPSYNFRGAAVLNLGCGKTTYASPNVINADVVKGPGINLVLKSNKIPLPSDSIDFIIANHVLEHIPNWFDTFKELARVLKPGGVLEVWIPPISSDSAFSYRDHLNRIGMLSFMGCSNFKNPGNNALASEQFKAVGDVMKLRLVSAQKRSIVKWWTMLAWPSLLEWMSNHLRNIVSEEQFVFRKEGK